MTREAKIDPDPDCQLCQGNGVVRDFVVYDIEYGGKDIWVRCECTFHGRGEE